MKRIEDHLEIMIRPQKRSQLETQEDIACIKSNQNTTKEILTTLGVEVNKNFKQIQEHKKESDNTLSKFRKALEALDEAMNHQIKESPRRKIRRPTKPPEHATMDYEEDSDDASYGSFNSSNNNKAPRSDDEMKVAADGI